MRITIKNKLARLAQNAAEHPVENDELLLWPSEAVAGPTGPAERRLAPPRRGCLSLWARSVACSS